MLSIKLNNSNRKVKNMKKEIKKFCKENNLTEKQFKGQETVGGYLKRIWRKFFFTIF